SYLLGLSTLPHLPPFPTRRSSDLDKVQSRVIRERLLREAEGNVAIRVTEGEDNDSFDVAGRGELQLAVLIENMRREGFELTIGRSEEHTSELQSRENLVCRLLLEK